MKLLDAIGDLRLGTFADNTIDAFEAFATQEDVEHFAKQVQNSVIAENNYNIAVSSYVDAEDTREQVDIRALNAEIARIVGRQAQLRTGIDAIVADLERDGSRP